MTDIFIIKRAIQNEFEENMFIDSEIVCYVATQQVAKELLKAMLDREIQTLKAWVDTHVKTGSDKNVDILCGLYTNEIVLKKTESNRHGKFHEPHSVPYLTIEPIAVHTKVPDLSEWSYTHEH